MAIAPPTMAVPSGRLKEALDIVELPKSARRRSQNTAVLNTAVVGWKRRWTGANDRARAKASRLARARAPIRLLKGKRRVAALGGGHELERDVTLAVPNPGARRLIGHPAMSGAIGAALRRLDAAINELLARRIADRPPAGVFADLLEPDLQHLSDLRFGEDPGWLPLARDGGNGGAPPERLRARNRGTTRPLRDRSRRRGGEQWMLPVSLIPIRFALPITALREGAPSAAAMLLALFPSSAICLRVSIAVFGPHVPRLRYFSVSPVW